MSQTDRFKKPKIKAGNVFFNFKGNKLTEVSWNYGWTN